MATDGILCIVLISPSKKKVFMELLKNFFKMAINRIKGLAHLSYEERSKHLGPFNLEKSRPRQDMIEVYKIIHGGITVDREKTSFSFLIG